MTDQRSQNSLLMTFGVLFTVIALVSITALVFLKTKADDTNTNQEVTVENIAPTVDSISLGTSAGGGQVSTAGTFTPNEGTTKSLYVEGTVSDTNGCEDLASVNVRLYRSEGVGVVFCMEDDNSCYLGTTSSFSGCTPGGGDLDATFSVLFTIKNYVDPTDAGSPYAVQTWKAYTTVVDDEPLGGSAMSATFEVTSLAALDLSSATINYGTVALGGTSTEQPLTFSNTGNREVDALVKATTFTSDTVGYDTIPSTQVHFSPDTGFAWADGTAVTTAPTQVSSALTLAKQTTGTVPTEVLYYRFKMPASGVRGVYSNIATFTASAL